MVYLGSHTGGGTDHTARLLVSCPDGPGIVAALARFLHEKGANIVTSDQYSTHPESGTFFMRQAFFLPEIEDDRAGFEEDFKELAQRFAMTWRVSYASDRRRVALMASRESHCLLDLLWRQRQHELEMDVICVISNHDTARREVENLDVRFLHVPVTPDTKAEAEARVLAELAGDVDLVVLARYMQVLSGDFLHQIGCPIINIHHSMLPAFAGAHPYQHAHERGVKLIGATAHYVTEELDEGPIIEQDVIRVGHRYTVDDLERVGRDLERVVLARAVRAELDDRVLLHGGRTIVF
ncbi:MAG TPA: formyltetrahydrofolate deformylase [Solirubrobacteraceae bacterium]|jgi:formyltetrahydrofolate deformylase|nr:formyltetrahydrofolate deformylase [Solirubrobacteraceae bacterium]